VNRNEFRSKLHEYLIAKGNLPAEWECGDEDNLFDRGVVESFDLPGLVDFLEGLTGTRLDLMDRKIEVFYSMGSMYDAFIGSA
jgi:hypothetical protein